MSLQNHIDLFQNSEMIYPEYFNMEFYQLMEACRWSIPTKLIDTLRYSYLEVDDCFHIAAFIVRNCLDAILFVNYAKKFNYFKRDFNQFEILLNECCDDLTHGSNLRKNWGTYDIRRKQWIGDSARHDERMFLWCEQIDPKILCRMLYQQMDGGNIPKWFEPWICATNCNEIDRCDCGRNSDDHDCI
ncbi:uncharacterized protein LOC123296232 [Chrysoperla carnea]|uniref:uncharacterized protein LOC123296232 n=1 Tax=Chrysoperla carnea TaxID=189513 RepID=UPI001D05E4B6|nr:uncharacterized protein LOC123296232 [Chrysoperla carnea]